MNITGLSDCPLNIDPSSYSCANPYPNCTNPASFQFPSLWIITQAIASCPNDSRLFNGLPMLTDASCRLFTHKKSWTPYSAADIWARLTTWKFPLLQLVAVFPRPPLTLLVEFFVLVHLLGDPISTINNLLLKMASCQARALFWKDIFENGVMVVGHLTRPSPPPILSSTPPSEPPALLPPSYLPSPSREGIWKGLAAIVDSYDEWGPDVGSAAESFILDRLTNNSVTADDQRKFLEMCRLTANALAADRSTKFLPIIVAQGFFIGTIAIAFERTKDSASLPNPTVFINIEAHSIAFSSLYFWIIPAVMISSIIGVSQTEAAIPRILKRFKDAVHAEFPNWENEMRLLKENLTTELRERSGGIYSWQPKESRTAVENAIRRTDPYRNILWRGPFDTSWRRVVSRCITLRPGSEVFPVVIFTYGALTGILISYLIPPVGFDCRHVGELLITLTWILSARLNNLPIFSKIYSDNEKEAVRARRRRFLFILWKDIIVTVLTMSGIIVTQVGVFNRCACYTRWGKVGLALPENKNVSKTLFWRIDISYPAIAFICVGFQLVIVPCLLLRQYNLAVRVFLQRDDEKSNLPGWVVRFYRWLVVVWEAIGEGAKKMRKGLGRGLMKLRKSRSEVIYTRAVPEAEHTAPSNSWIGKSDQGGGYEEIDLAQLGELRRGDR